MKEPVTAAVVVCVTLCGAASTVFMSRPVSSPAERPELEDIIVHESATTPVKLLDRLEPASYNAIIVFSPDCASCAPEAVVWQRLFRERHASINFVGLALTADTALVAELRSAAGLEFPVLFTELGTAQRLGIQSLPAIMVLDRAGGIPFSAGGRESTAVFADWLDAHDLR